ncbi:hypothetical protein DL240_16145 [Lujinxingia litoralis]|uniref:Uncharacterized protein n=1 Tax=Lujinxingia litoralis TaxID=2211119 RepID=A0A328C1U3_9DELT|nr:hypothetical protein [Lujinxingia litoralis]RAL20567.1 hypothetical protein DL240_16145 [Lujinxingia litoralis]
MSASIYSPPAELPGFRAGHCPECTQDVLAARDLVENELVEICVHCACNLSRHSPETLRWVEAPDVVELGYFIDGLESESCDSNGGCRDGACGVRQPT